MTIANQSRMSSELLTQHTPEAIRLRLRSSLRPSLVRDSILGATDGCVTTFAVVAGAIRGDLPANVVIILGCANLMADGFSMAAGNPPAKPCCWAGWRPQPRSAWAWD